MTGTIEQAATRRIDRYRQLLRDRTIEQAATRRIDRYRQLLRDRTIEQAATRRIDRYRQLKGIQFFSFKVLTVLTHLFL